MFLESNKHSQTFCLDLYKPGSAPGFTSRGLGQTEAGKGKGIVVLYRVSRNRVSHIWVDEDRDGMTEREGASEEDVTVRECSASFP